MAHHKKRRAKNQRAGCLFCKSWKINGAGKGGSYATRQERRAMAAERD